MPLLLPAPVLQFCDANGKPFAGGTIATYTPGTDEPKPTWQDHDGTVFNTQPIVLDAAGRAIIFGDGDYRFVLRDQDGNLIYDQWTSSVVSDAMQPVVRAGTIAEARDLLGITDAIQAETDRAEAAELALRNDLNAEIARAKAREDELQALIDGTGGDTGILPPGYSIRMGSATSDSAGNISAVYDHPFDHGTTSIVTTSGQHTWAGVYTATASGFTGLTSSPLFGGTWGGGPWGIWYIAIGN